MKKIKIFTAVSTFIISTEVFASSLGGVNASFVTDISQWALWILSVVAGIAIIIFVISKAFSLDLSYAANKILNYLLVIVIVLWAISLVANLFSGNTGSGFLLL